MTEKSQAFERLNGAINYAIVTKSLYVTIPMGVALEIRSKVAKQLEPLWPKKETDPTSPVKYRCGDCRMHIQPFHNFCWYCGRKILWYD